jgi:hypothetical protein
MKKKQNSKKPSKHQSMHIMPSDDEMTELRAALCLTGIGEDVVKLIFEMYQTRKLSSVKSPEELTGLPFLKVSTGLPLPLPHTLYDFATLGVIWDLFHAAEEEFHAYFKADEMEQQIEAEEVLGSLCPEDNEATLTPAIKSFLTCLCNLCKDPHHLHPISVEKLVHKKRAKGNFSGRIEFVTYQDYQRAFIVEAKRTREQLEVHLGQFAAELVFVLEEANVNHCGGILTNFVHFCVGRSHIDGQGVIHVEITGVYDCREHAMQFAHCIRELFCQDIDPFSAGMNQGMFNILQGNMKALRSEVRTDVKGVKTELKEVKTEMKEIKTELKEVKTEVKEIKTELTALKKQVTELQDIVQRIDNYLKFQYLWSSSSRAQ